MLDVDGAAAVENLRAELARAKEQARKSDAVAGKATEELKADERAASGRGPSTRPRATQSAPDLGLGLLQGRYPEHCPTAGLSRAHRDCSALLE